jgi:hypothetical protein
MDMVVWKAANLGEGRRRRRIFEQESSPVADNNNYTASHIDFLGFGKDHRLPSRYHCGSARFRHSGGRCSVDCSYKHSVSSEVLNEMAFLDYSIGRNIAGGIPSKVCWLQVCHSCSLGERVLHHQAG